MGNSATKGKVMGRPVQEDESMEVALRRRRPRHDRQPATTKSTPSANGNWFFPDSVSKDDDTLLEKGDILDAICFHLLLCNQVFLYYMVGIFQNHLEVITVGGRNLDAT
ncbi:hypothetical protein OIU84_022391, partial [Salix udensis]